MHNDDLLVVDLGFNSAKYICGAQKGRVPSAFRCEPGGCIYGGDAMYLDGFSCVKTPSELFRHSSEFVKLCRKLAGAQDRNVKLAIGLPARYIIGSRPGDPVFQLKQALSEEGFGAVHILSQTFGGIISFIDETERPRGDTIVVDIGFNSVSFTIHSEECGECIYAKALTRRGINQLAIDLVLPRIRHLSPFRTFNPLEISRIMERGEVRYSHFETIDIRSYFQQAAQEYVRTLFDDIQGEIEAEEDLPPVDDLNYVLIGGGAALLSGSLPPNMPYTILDEPEYAIARGIGAFASILFDG